MALLPIDLAMRAPRRASARLLWLWRSMASRLLLLTLVFVAVPVLLYDQFQRADEASQQLLLKSAQRQGELIARAFPRLAGVPVRALAGAGTGTVNAISRVGADVTARFPLEPTDAGWPGCSTAADSGPPTARSTWSARGTSSTTTRAPGFARSSSRRMPNGAAVPRGRCSRPWAWSGTTR